MFNIVSFGKRKENLVIAIERQLLGSCLRTIEEYLHRDSKVFLHCCGEIWGVAEIADNYFMSDSIVWSDKIYPHRFKLKNFKLLGTPVALGDGVINLEFRKLHGSAWAYRFLFSPKPLPPNIALLIEEKTNAASEVTFSEFKALLFDV